MGSFFENKANAITAGLILTVLLAGGYFLFKSKENDSPQTSFVSQDTQSLPIGFGAVSAGVSTNAPISNSLISVLSGLRTITLDGALFKDPAFLSLEDFGVPLQIESVGRYNPFLPIGVDVVNESGSQSVPVSQGIKNPISGGSVTPPFGR